MFKDLLNRLLQPEPALIANDDARLALTALLVRVARSDSDYSLGEQGRIDNIIKDRYGLSDVDTAKLRAEAESMEAEAEEEKEAEAQEDDYRYDYLSDTDSKFHLPSIGSIPAFGQEGVLYRPKDTGMLW